MSSHFLFHLIFSFSIKVENACKHVICFIVSFYSESRYLLLLTENYGALSILQQQIIAKQNEIRPVTIFGSSFPSDQEYTQVGTIITLCITTP